MKEIKSTNADGLSWLMATKHLGIQKNNNPLLNLKFEKQYPVDSENKLKLPKNCL